MNAYAFHFLFELRTGVRNKTLLLMNYLFPLGVFLLIGGIMPGINPLFRDVLVPGMVTFAILGVALLGLPDPLVNARESGIFRSYKINGVPSISILLIPALTTALHVTIVTGIIVVSAPLLFDAPLPVDWGAFLLVFCALTIACAGLSVLIGVISPNSRMTVLWSQVVFVPSMLLGGLMMPYSFLPDAAAKAAQLLPATHAMNAFRGLSMTGSADFPPWGSILVMVLGGVIAFLLGVYLFSWDDKNAGRRGHPLLALFALLPYAVGIFIF